MTAQKIIAAMLFSLSLALWAVMIYSVFILPHQVAVWADTAQALPPATLFLVSIGELCQRFGLVLFPSLFLMTIGAAAWFIMVSMTKRKR